MTVSKWKHHPDYTEGFDDAMEGKEPAQPGWEPYEAGHAAAKRVKALLGDHGFKETAPGEFSIKTVIKA